MNHRNLVAPATIDRARSLSSLYMSTCLVLGIQAWDGFISPAAGDAAIPPECSAETAEIVADAAARFWDEAEPDDALRALDRLSLSTLERPCRAHVLALKAEILITKGRAEDARDLYRAGLTEDGSWRPELTSRSESVFDGVLNSWSRDHAGPIRVLAPGGSVQFEEENVEPGAVAPTMRPLALRTSGVGELSWIVTRVDPGIVVSRMEGTTVGGRDSLLVGVNRSRRPEVGGEFAGSIVIATVGWPDQTVPVKWKNSKGGCGLFCWTKRGAALTVAVVAAVLLLGDDSPEDDGEDLPDPPGPPARK